MFNKTNQVQTIDVNEWVNKLLSARDDVKAIERIRVALDNKCAGFIEERERCLKARQSMYDFYYEGMPCSDDFALQIMNIIDYRMPEPLVEHWQEVCERYRTIKSEKEQTDGQNER